MVNLRSYPTRILRLPNAGGSILSTNPVQKKNKDDWLLSIPTCPPRPLTSLVLLTLGKHRAHAACLGFDPSVAVVTVINLSYVLENVRYYILAAYDSY